MCNQLTTQALQITAAQTELASLLTFLTDQLRAVYCIINSFGVFVETDVDT